MEHLGAPVRSQYTIDDLLDIDVEALLESRQRHPPAMAQATPPAACSEASASGAVNGNAGEAASPPATRVPEATDSEPGTTASPSPSPSPSPPATGGDPARGSPTPDGLYPLIAVEDEDVVPESQAAETWGQTSAPAASTPVIALDP